MNKLTPNERPPLGAGRAPRFIPNLSVPNHQRRPAMRIYLYIVLVLLTLLTACSKRAQVVGIGDDDPEMAAAIAQARQTLPHFWQVFDKREHGESNFVLVVRITDNGRIEHFFTTDFERRDGKTMVTISNAPKIVASVKAGDQVEIPLPISPTGVICATGNTSACAPSNLDCGACRQPTSNKSNG